jgi:hypothetical protein
MLKLTAESQNITNSMQIQTELPHAHQISQMIGGKKSQFCLADDEVHEMQSLKKLMSSHIQTRDRMKSYMFPEEEIEKLREKNPTIKNKDKRTPLEPEIIQLNLPNILPSMIWKRKISR